MFLNCHATLCYCVQSHSKLSVTIYQNKIFVFAVALTDTQAKIPLKHCFHQHTSPAGIVSKFYTVLSTLYVFRTCCNWAFVMLCSICFTNYCISSQHGKVTVC